jgi:hypothetical protein
MDYRAIAFRSQSQSAKFINISQDGDRLGLTSVSKAERPFGLEQAAVSGVVLLRSYVFAVQGDSYAPRVRVSARWFLWREIGFGSDRAISKWFVMGDAIAFPQYFSFSPTQILE